MTITKIDETAEVDWTRYQGDSMTIEIYEEDSNGDPIDYTGGTVRFAVGTINEATSGVTAAHGSTLGTISIFIPDSVMDDLEVGDYDLAVEIYFAATTIRRTLLTGAVHLVEDVRT
ncbi:hypothetical protein M0R72_12340 [Candidatus Pacearchaeota archaeon]|jgi:hypothetical protein|nr:hypothetical protein [Candidatus Pacearchaeota archaeon]